VTLALPGTRLANVGRPDETEVRMLAVSDDARGRGIGHALMEACESRSRAEGVVAVVLSTEPDMVAAQHLYVRRGYVRVPDRDWTISRFRLLVYRKALVTGAASRP
jgi:ribosomal protein S18 acetylase RimI-like enzyme